MSEYFYKFYGSDLFSLFCLLHTALNFFLFFFFSFFPLLPIKYIVNTTLVTKLSIFGHHILQLVFFLGKIGFEFGLVSMILLSKYLLTKN